MHDLLGIPELVHCICENVNDVKSLYSLIFVCKAMMEPALDFLWLDQKDFSVLLKTFPSDSWIYHEVKVEKSDSWEVKRLKLEQTRMVFTRRLNRENDWARYEYYASRMRTLNLDSGNGWGNSLSFGLEVFEEMQFANRPLPLLPNLQSIKVGDFKLDIGLFLGPCLQQIEIHLSDDDYDVAGANALAAVTTLIPSLTGVTIRCNRAWAFSANSLFKTHLQLTRVELTHHYAGAENAMPLSYEGLVNLSHLGTLQELVVAVEDNTFNRSASSLPMGSFQSLSKLEIDSDHLACATQLLQALNAPVSLRELTARIWHAASSEGIANFCARMRDVILPQKFISFTIWNNEGHVIIEDMFPAFVLDPNAIDLLFSFHKLKTITIAMDLSLELFGRSFIEKIAVAWPQLELLSLDEFRRDESYWIRNSGIELNDLAPLARCKMLRLVSINLHSPTNSIDDISKAINLGGHSDHANDCSFELNVGVSPIDSAVLVAQILSNLPLSLGTITYTPASWDQDSYGMGSVNIEGYAQRWDEVKTLLSLPREDFVATIYDR